MPIVHDLRSVIRGGQAFDRKAKNKERRDAHLKPSEKKKRREGGYDAYFYDRQWRAGQHQRATEAAEAWKKASAAFNETEDAARIADVREAAQKQYAHEMDLQARARYIAHNNLDILETTDDLPDEDFDKVFDYFMGRRKLPRYHEQLFDPIYRRDYTDKNGVTHKAGTMNEAKLQRLLKAADAHDRRAKFAADRQARQAAAAARLWEQALDMIAFSEEDFTVTKFTHGGKPLDSAKASLFKRLGHTKVVHLPNGKKRLASEWLTPDQVQLFHTSRALEDVGNNDMYVGSTGWLGSTEEGRQALLDMGFTEEQATKLQDDYMGLDIDALDTTAEMIQQLFEADADADTGVIARDGQGHIAHVAYAEAQAMMEIRFASGTIIVYLHVPPTVAGELLYLCTDSSTDANGHHLLGKRFWDLVRVRGKGHKYDTRFPGYVTEIGMRHTSREHRPNYALNASYSGDMLRTLGNPPKKKE